MICVHLHSVLLITLTEDDHDKERIFSAGPWIAVESQAIGEVLRQVRFYRPRVVVFDLSMLFYGSDQSDRALQVISAVRNRTPGISIVVLGPCEDPAMEPAVRREGASVYLPVTEGHDRGDVHRIVQVLRDRAGPNRTHGPPASGVPPR